jgi:hypothetical protein
MSNTNFARTLESRRSDVLDSGRWFQAHFYNRVVQQMKVSDSGNPAKKRSSSDTVIGHS